MTRDTEDHAVAIARLTQEGMEYKDRDPEEAISRFHTAYQKSRLIDDDSTERTCAFNLGAAYVGIGKAKEALKYLHKAIPPESESDLSSDGDLYFNMAVAYEQLDEDKNALRYYEKAHDEFRLRGGTNLALEMHCLQKCLSLQQKLRKFADAAKVYKQMAAVHSAKKEYLNQADCLCKMAVQFQRAKQVEDAENAGMLCINVFNEITTEGKECFVAGRVLNELGLLYTQMQKYANALQCFERALEFVSLAEGADAQLHVVIKQNLGAVYNFLGEFQRAIRFHEEAIEHYAKLNYRNGQGQCFTNLAFALSQMMPQDLRRAELAFHHALRAAKDTSDINMRWQVLEGLGAVSFNQQNFEGAIAYFQDALQCVGEDTVASERIKMKLRLVTEYNMTQQSLKRTGQESATLRSHNDLMMRSTDKSPRFGTIFEGAIVAQEVTTPHEAPMMSRSLQSEVPAPAPTPAAPQQRRMVPIRKRDSVGPHMPKVARGLTTMSLDSDRPMSRGLLVTQEEDEQTESSDSSEDSDGSGSDSRDGPHGRRMIPIRKRDSFGPHIPKVARGLTTMSLNSDRPMSRGLLVTQEEDEQTESSDSSEDSDGSGSDSRDGPHGGASKSETVQEIFAKKKANQNNADPTYQTGPRASTDPDTERYQAMLREQEQREEEESGEEEDSDSDSNKSSSEESSSGEEESDDDDETESEQIKKKVPVAPQSPYESPAPTSEVNTRDLATYLPAQAREHSQNTPLASSHRDSSRSKVKKQAQQEEEESSESEDEEEHPYAVIGQTTRSQREFADDEAESHEEKEEKKDWPNPTESRGHKEMMLFQEHQRMRQEQAEGPPLPPRSDEKRSKTCAIM